MKRLLAVLLLVLALPVRAGIILESTDSIELITSSAEAIDYTASWADNTTTVFTPGKSAGQIAAATTTTIVAAPAASTQRTILQITLYNAGAATNTLTVQRDVSATNRLVFKVTLIAAERLHYEDGNGWTIYDANGLAKVGGGIIPTGTGYRHITTGAEDAAADLVTLTSATEVAANQGTTTTLLHGNAAGQASFGPVVTGDITDGTVAYADIQNLGALSVMGRAANSIGVGADVSGTAGQVLRVSGVTVLGFGSIDLSAAAAVGTTILPLANGGTNNSAAASNGAIIYSDATKHLPSAVGTAGQGFFSGGAGAPTWADESKIVRLTSDYTNASSALTNTALTWTSPASVSRSGFDCVLMVKSSATSAGPQFDVNSSVAPTTITYKLEWVVTVGTPPSTAGTTAFVDAQANATLLGPAGVALTTYSIFRLTGVIVHTSSASTVTVRGKNGAAGTITVGSGSYCAYYVL